MVPLADQIFYGCPEIIKNEGSKIKGTPRSQSNDNCAPREEWVLKVSNRSFQSKVNKYRRSRVWNSWTSKHPRHNPKWMIYLGKVPRCYSLREEDNSKALQKIGVGGSGSSNCAWNTWHWSTPEQNKVLLNPSACPLPIQAAANRENCQAMCSTFYMEGAGNPLIQGQRELGKQTCIPEKETY